VVVWVFVLSQNNILLLKLSCFSELNLSGKHSNTKKTVLPIDAAVGIATLLDIQEA
jgi:hypothetical protein